MLSLAERVFKLAADAAKLAGEMLPQRDISRDLTERMREHGMTVTHAGHALFAAAEAAFSGAKPFQVEELILRTSEGALRIDYCEDLRWLAFNARVTSAADLVLTVDLDADANSPVSALIRCRSADGKHLDGPRVLLGNGHVQTDRYIHHPSMDGADYTSHLFITINNFSGAHIRKIAFASAPR